MTTPQTLRVLDERPWDHAPVRALYREAFGRPVEADLVDGLRAVCIDLLSLAALRGEDVVGHILFSPVRVQGGGRTLTGMGLGPMAVRKELRGQGLGSALVEAGLERLCAQGAPFCVVLGHPGYYPRFGFSPASRFGIHAPWEGPDEAFMVKVLVADALEGVRGLARYRPEFDAAG